MAVKRKKEKGKRKKKPAGNPEEVALFNNLCAAINDAGIETRVEKGRFRGGICVVDGEKEMLFINKTHTYDRRIALLLEELAKLNMLDAVLSDELRGKLETMGISGMPTGEK